MKKLKLLWVFSYFLVGTANAETTSETLCFVSETDKRIEMVLQKYLDEKLQKEVGAFVKYSTSKNTISLVYISDSTSDESLDYELQWLEIYNGKITGTYRLLKPKSATILGAYVKYKNNKTNVTTYFIPSGKSGSDCKVNAN